MNTDRPESWGCQIGTCRTIAETWWRFTEDREAVAVCGIHAAAMRAAGVSR